MNVGVFPKKGRYTPRKYFTESDFREMETKLNDETYIQAAIYRLASILTEQMMYMKDEE
ncbi:MAG: hypothetical protein ACFNYQ_12320 [Treponema sp.]|jgi:hypothetical protein|uniref:hypothetical protein n=1 Tax=Treponema TaxID=157 RepID=UPI00193A73C7|nr:MULTISPECIES: hypothetical protein [Treponema]UTC52286.1 hypothetical protein ABH09_07885 [Treponema sp. OMZ 803]UTC54701.1 hypothetical protein E4N69_07905 [Treponema sp. OMZ 906]